VNHLKKLYIGGRWVAPALPVLMDLISPDSETPCAQVACGSALDVDRAVDAARQAFPEYSRQSREARATLMRNIVKRYEARRTELAEAITREMGAPISLSLGVHTATALSVANHMISVLEKFEFETRRGSTLIVHEPIGVCGLITSWNSPLFVTFLKLAPALAAGCTVVVKPSEQAPLSAVLLAEILDEAGLPEGVFNLVQGDGRTVGAAIAVHPGIDMLSFTGSTQTGIRIAQDGATTVKRVVQELGGKSANILLPDADFTQAVQQGVAQCFNNSGQICVAPTRMLVPTERLDEVKALAKKAAEAMIVGDPRLNETQLGPVATRAQFDKVQSLIAAGIQEGAELVTGGLGRPPHLDRGYYVRPTVFAGVHNDMRIAREEIFGPVLSIIPYRSEEEAIQIANDSTFGLSGYVRGKDMVRAQRVAARLRCGTVNINYPPSDPAAPIGGYRQSGNGREKGEAGLMEYLETKAIIGYGAT